MTELAERSEDGRPLLAEVGSVDLAPLGVIERAAAKELVLDETGRVELAGARMVGTSAARATAWVVFTRHRLTCPGGVDPAACGCETEPDAYHAYLAEPGMDDALPLRPDLGLPPQRDRVDTAPPADEDRVAAAVAAERHERRQCVDCPSGSRSAAKFPGPRCRSHHSRKQREASNRQHDRMVLAKYGITGEQYQAIYEAQGWWCAICNLAIGSSKRRLAVDHDHRCCRGSQSCGRCVRGLLCGACNRFLKIIQDDPEAFLRGYEYLINPPAQAVLGEQRSDAEQAEGSA